MYIQKYRCRTSAFSRGSLNYPSLTISSSKVSCHEQSGTHPTRQTGPQKALCLPSIGSNPRVGQKPSSSTARRLLVYWSHHLAPPGSRSVCPAERATCDHIWVADAVSMIKLIGSQIVDTLSEKNLNCQILRKPRPDTELTLVGGC